MPLALIEKTEAVEVANVEALEVAKYRLPPAFRKLQWLSVRTDGSDNVSWAPVLEATWRAQRGVVVPMPKVPTSVRVVLSTPLVLRTIDSPDPPSSPAWILKRLSPES